MRKGWHFARSFRTALALAAVLFPRESAAQDGQGKSGNASAPDKNDYTTPRTEPAGFPILGGSSDIGFQFGFVGTLAHFGNDVRPYLWDLDLFLSAAYKPGTGFTQETIQTNIDIPGLYGGKLRLTPEIAFTRTTNLGYFGLGNASSDVVPPVVFGDPHRYFQSIQHELLVRAMGRVNIGLPFDLVPLLVYRYEDPVPYAGSKLAIDSVPPAPGEQPAALGVQKLSLVSIGGGVIFDSRDNEYFPYRGHYHQLGIKYVQGIPFSADIQYGQESNVFAWFIPLHEKFVFATRALLDLQVGNVPFYDLFSGGPFKTQYMLGGSAGIRGVPIGRFLGRIKIIANEEVRTMFWDFKLAGQAFHVGAGAFFDTGRLWLNYTFDAPQDGSFPGLKFGTGLAGYVIWGQAAVFRVDVAYSPSATAFSSSSIPIAIYVEDNMMF
jgi:hypothetical protein